MATAATTPKGFSDKDLVSLMALIRGSDSVELKLTVLGTVYEGQGHVHLSRFHEGQPINPLAFGALIGYQDHQAPAIGALTAFSPSGALMDLDALRGSVGLCVRAHDIQGQSGLWTGLYSMSYVIFDDDDRVAVGPYHVFRMDRIPITPVGNLMYTVSSTRHSAQPDITYRVTLKSPSGDGYPRRRARNGGMARRPTPVGRPRGDRGVPGDPLPGDPDGRRCIATGRWSQTTDDS